MTDLLVDPSRPAAPRPSGPMPGLLRWLYTQNPFYIISADLVFLGLRMSFDPDKLDFDTWALMSGLGGYTLLLAVTACLLVRFGKVWDDVRSLLLLVVMMFLAISVTFDEILVVKPRLGSLCFLGGLLFSVVVSEGLLRGMRLRLPALYRVPYYLILALFFLYPVALASLRDRPEEPLAYWAVFGFSPIAGAIFLTLLPAIRRGPAYLRGNGSPWRWPMYPWSLFVFLALGVCGRSYYLCTSLHNVDTMDWSLSIFGPFFLAPFLLAVAVLLLEIGIVARHRSTIRLALVMPIGLVVLCLVGHRTDEVYRRFLGLIEGRFGCDPPFAALVAAMAFYAVAIARRIPEAWSGLLAALIGLTVVAPRSLGFDDLVRPQAVPLLLIAGLQGWRAIRDRSGWRALVAAACLVMATLDVPMVRDLDRPVLVGFHLGLVAVLAVGAVLDDRLGDFLRRFGAFLLMIAALASAAGDLRLFPALPDGATPGYPLILAGVALAYGFWFGGEVFYVPATIALGIALLMSGGRGYLQLRKNVAGLDRITLGLASFLVAALISFRKTGYRLPVSVRDGLFRRSASRPKPRPADDFGG